MRYQRPRSEDTDRSTTIGRRGFLHSVAGTATVGVAGFALTGTASAADAAGDYPRVSTRDHFDDADLIDGESTYSYDIEGDWLGIGGDTLAIWVHG